MLHHKNTIVILTSKTGGGHVSLAEALRDLLEKGTLEKDATDTQNRATLQTPAITIIDPQPGFFHLHYRLVSRYALWLWAAEFQFFDTPRRAQWAHHVFSLLVQQQLHTLLDKITPTLIITTYPFLTSEVMRVLAKRASQIPLVLLFSDANGVHSAWLTEQRTQATFAPTRETYQQALTAGFAAERLHLVGWPVRAQFAQAFLASQEERDAQLQKLNLVPSRFTIFLQGGGEGAAHITQTVENILTASDLAGRVQIILAAGTNRALQEKYKGRGDVAVLPYTKEIAWFMSAADVVMGKAGPNMLFESVMLGKPFIASAYIPGQEQANLAFIQRHGLGWVTLQPAEQRKLITSLIHNPKQIQDMSTTLKAYRQWNLEANTQIVPLLYAMLS